MFICSYATQTKSLSVVWNQILCLHTKPKLKRQSYRLPPLVSTCDVAYYVFTQIVSRRLQMAKMSGFYQAEFLMWWGAPTEIWHSGLVHIIFCQYENSNLALRNLLHSNSSKPQFEFSKWKTNVYTHNSKSDNK